MIDPLMSESNPILTGVRPRALFLFVVGLVLSLSSHGCSDSESDALENGDVQSSVPTRREFDLASIMNGMSTALQDEVRVLRKVLKDWETINESDLRTFASAYAERRQLAEEFEAMIQAHPDWSERVCEWYSAVLETPQLSLTKVRGRILNTPDQTVTQGSRWFRLTLDVSELPGMDTVDHGYTMIYPGSPFEIRHMCLNDEGVMDDEN